MATGVRIGSAPARSTPQRLAVCSTRFDLDAIRALGDPIIDEQLDAAAVPS